MSVVLKRLALSTALVYQRPLELQAQSRPIQAPPNNSFNPTALSLPLINLCSYILGCRYRRAAAYSAFGKQVQGSERAQERH